jgi:hypothetical protein
VIERSGRVAGEVRAAGGGGFGAGNVTFVNVYEAGFVIHMWLEFPGLIESLSLDTWYLMTNLRRHW